MFKQTMFAIDVINRCAKKIFVLLCATLVGSTLFVGSVAAETDPALHDVQAKWAVANYELQGDEKEKAFESLLAYVDQLTKQQPTSAELWAWSGIIKSSYAGVKGGLGGLSLAKQSRQDLEQSLAINPDALQGSAYTSLGALYSKVPGWPVGFGSDKKATEMFTKALQINPKGIDSNYFYAEFMLDEGKLEEAEQHYLLAQQAAPRPDRPLADKGRQQEIAVALEKVRKKSKTNVVHQATVE